MQKLRNLIISGIVTVLSAATFICGCGQSSYDWFIQTVNEKYYFGELGEIPETDLSEIAAKYLDRYSAYYTKEEYEKLKLSNAGEKSGLGFGYSYAEGKGVLINTVYGNSPAYISGLREGERLVSGSSELGGSVTFDSSKDFAELISSVGAGGELTLVSADGLEYRMAKSEYTASYTYMSTNRSTWVFGDAAAGGLSLYEKPEKLTFLPDGAAYIRLVQFYGNAVQEFLTLIEKFNASNCTTLILDLRSNGGGYLEIMCGIAGAFSGGASKPALIARDKHGTETVYDCEKVEDENMRVGSGTDVYVLANSSSASASEALIGAMICYGALGYENVFLSDYSEEYLGWLKAAGQEEKTARTYGKGIMQSTYRNRSTGEALKLTTSQIYWPDGTTCIHDRGLTAADGCTPVPAEWVRTRPDAELQVAVGIIQSRNK